MTCRLRTRCGCEREINLPAPLPPYVLLPLVEGESLFHHEMAVQRCDIHDTTTYGVRKFKRWGTTNNYLEAM